MAIANALAINEKKKFYFLISFLYQTTLNSDISFYYFFALIFSGSFKIQKKKLK